MYVVPTLNLGGPLNAYVKKAGVALAKPEASIIRSGGRSMRKNTGKAPRISARSVVCSKWKK